MNKIRVERHDSLMIKIEQWLERHKITAFFLNRDNFAFIYITICILWFFPLLGWLMNPLSKVCFVWGALLILWDLLTKRQMLKSVYWILPLLIILSFGITIFLNIKYSFYMGVKHMVYLGISLLLLYGQDRNRSVDSIKKLLYRVNTVIIAIVFIAAVVSLLMFVFQVSFSFYSGDMLLRQGFLENRLFGVYTSPNTGALFVVISIAAMLMNSAIKNQGKIKLNWFYIVNLVVQAVYFSLTLSRGGLWTLAAFILVFVIVYLFPKVQNKAGTLKAAGASILAVILLFGGSNAAMQGIRYGMAYIPSLVGTVKPPETPEDPETPSKEPDKNTNKIEFDRIEANDDLSNGRFTIWTGGLKALLQHPLFGYANMWLSEEDNLRFDISAFSDEERGWLFKHAGNLHNAYIQVAVYSGVVGFLLFAVFGFLLIKKVGLILLRGKKNTPLYNILAILFSIIMAIAVNGLFEAHLLYTRQDPYGAIFWLYAGLTAVLAELYQCHEENRVDERFAFAADTPFQAMNCLNFVLNDTESSAGSSDLYLYHQFRNSHAVSDRIKQSGVFRHVYDIEPYADHASPIQKFITIFRIFLPQRAIQASCKEKIHFNQKGYRKLCISFPTTFTLGLHMAFPHADVYHMEDGLGSYSGNLNTDYSSRLFRFLDRVVYRGDLGLHPTACYLSAPEFSRNTIEGEDRKLPLLRQGPELETMQRIFDYHPNTLYHKRAVYLTQPLDERSTYCPEQEKRVVELLKSVLGDRVVARVHPRQMELDFGGMEKDTYGNLWELECVSQINDDNILISAFSTAQFMPKIIADTEPALIFTYRLLFTSCEDPFIKDMAKLIDDFRALYREPGKIYVPETLDDLKAICAGILRQG